MRLNPNILFAKLPVIRRKRETELRSRPLELKRAYASDISRSCRGVTVEI